MSNCEHQDDTHYEFLVESPYTGIESPEEMPVWNDDEEVLECHRDGKSFCVFHQELDHENRESVRENLISELEQDTDDPLLVADGSFCRLIINDITIKRPVWLVGSEFDGRFELDDVTFEQEFMVQGSVFNDVTIFDNVTFESEVSMRRTRFRSEFECHMTTFEGETDMMNMEFDSNCLFDRTKFKDDCTFEYTTFHEETRLASCRFSGKTNFYGVEFETETKIARARDVEDVDAQVNSKTRFDSRVKFREVKFKQNARINIKLEADADFQYANLSDCNFKDVDLRGANLENANLSNSVLYDADLRGCKMMGTDFDGVRLNGRSRILGNPNEEAVDGYDHSITSIFHSKTCYYDPESEYRDETDHEEELQNKARTVYRELQELGKSTSNMQLQTRAFVRRKDMEKSKYWNDITSMESGPTQPLVAGVRWLRAKFSRTIMLYGESPWRVLISSGATILLFALAYIIFGLIEGPDGVVDISPATIVQDPQMFAEALTGSVYYSALIFTNLSFGRYSPVGAGTYVTAVETAVGLTMLALFFFVLGRRASR